MRQLIIFTIVTTICSIGWAAEPELWFYQAANLLPRENIDTVEAVWRKAAKAGYSHVLLSDSKFGRLGEMPKSYTDHVERLKKLAGELKLEIVPAAFSVGYSNDLLSQNPNLAEGQPVKDALFVVENGEAKLVADPGVSLPAKPAWKDDVVSIDGNVATVRNNPANARLNFVLKVAPFRCYHASVWIKTDGYSGKPEMKALAGEPATVLNYNDLGVKQSQKWTEHHIVFNSLDNTEVKLYLGTWGKATGTLQWRDWKVEEAGLVNVLRRPGAPVTVKGYVEGKDYEPIVDPLLGTKPWKGEYTVWHEPPTIKTKLPDGTKLRVSWYHPAIIYSGSVCLCLSEPESQQQLAKQAKQVRELWQPKGMMMSHDEIRIMNWDAACQARHLSPAEILSDNVSWCTDQLKGMNVYVWNDMFDPHHNAHDKYYLVNGDLTGSWKGLPSSVTVINWNFGERDASSKFFADRGHQQIVAGYYDDDVNEIKKWMKTAENVKGVIGYMYTTWRDNYDDLEAFAKLVRQP